MGNVAQQSTITDNIGPGSQPKEISAFFIPESANVPPNNYRRLVEYMVAKYGRGGLPARSYPATADLLSREVGWPVDASCLNTAHWRWLRKQKSSKIIGAPISTAKRN